MDYSEYSVSAAEGFALNGIYDALQSHGSDDVTIASIAMAAAGAGALGMCEAEFIERCRALYRRIGRVRNELKTEHECKCGGCDG